MENLRTRIDVQLENNEKDYLKRTSKPSYMSHKMLGNNLIAIRKSKITLTLDKPAYIGICILDLSKVLICRFRYDVIENKYGNNSRLLFIDSDSLMYEKPKMSMKILVDIKKCSILVIIQLSRDTMIILTN